MRLRYHLTPQNLPQPFTMLYLPTYDFLHKTLLERQQCQVVSDLEYPSDSSPLEDSPSSSYAIDIDTE